MHFLFYRFITFTFFLNSKHDEPSITKAYFSCHGVWRDNLFTAILFYKIFFAEEGFEKDLKLNLWVVYKEALDDHEFFRNVWNTIVGAAKKQAPPPSKDNTQRFEEFASIMTGLWSMVDFNRGAVYVQGRKLFI